jgi:hypothetical protein
VSAQWIVLYEVCCSISQRSVDNCALFCALNSSIQQVHVRLLVSVYCMRAMRCDVSYRSLTYYTQPNPISSTALPTPTGQHHVTARAITERAASNGG